MFWHVSSHHDFILISSSNNHAHNGHTNQISTRCSTSVKSDLLELRLGPDKNISYCMVCCVVVVYWFYATSNKKVEYTIV